jgi:hypothetical protein
MEPKQQKVKQIASQGVSSAFENVMTQCFKLAHCGASFWLPYNKFNFNDFFLPFFKAQQFRKFSVISKICLLF